MWVYQQSTGKLGNDNGDLFGAGYSGNTTGLNNPDAEDQHDVGPIPRGIWTIGEFLDDLCGKGPIVAHLTPISGTETFGRGGFMIHGDNSAANHTASHGCVILARPLREAIKASSDRTMKVIA